MRSTSGFTTLVLAAALLAACGDASSTSTSTGQGAGASGGMGTGGSAIGGADGGHGGVGGGATGPVDPGYPVFPATIGTLSVSIRTADVEFAGTDDGHLSLCLAADRCFLLDTPGTSADNVPWPNELQQGEIDTFHFEGVDLPRADVDRVELRTSDGANAYRPGCLEIRFDGEPMHCNDALDVLIGSAGPPEVTSYADPAGLHEICESCFPEPVTLGPLLGAVSPTTARLWVRTDATRRVIVYLAPASDPGAEQIAAYLYPLPSDDFIAEVSLEGLSPATDYVYRFDVDGRGTSESYGFRTAPAPGGQQTRIAMGSCIRDEPAPIFTTIAADAPDVFLYLGDNHYANVNHITSLDDDRLGILRWNYRRALLQPDRALLARTASTLAIWDDHDFLGNNTVGSAPGKAVAKRAFDEYWANSLSGTSGTPGVYSVEHYGDVDFFLLDDRYDRSPESDPGGSMLSAGQMEWLKTELAASTAVFKIVANGSLFSYAGETWKDFPAARQAFFDFLADNQVEGVVLVAGDVHRSLFRSIPRTKGYALPELVSSPLANPGSTCTNDPDATTLGCFATGNYFVTMDVDTTVADPTLTARIRDEGGATLLTWTLLRSELQD